MITRELKPLRKNSRQASYIVAEEVDGVYVKHTYYATEDEAIFHAMTAKNGDIIIKGSSKLLAFYCKHSNAMRFGFGATEWDRRVLEKACWWANWNTPSQKMTSIPR